MRFHDNVGYVLVFVELVLSLSVLWVALMLWGDLIRTRREREDRERK